MRRLKGGELMFFVFARASCSELERVLDSIEESRIAIVDGQKERYKANPHGVWERNQRMIVKKSRCIPYMTLMIKVLFSILGGLAGLALAVFSLTVLSGRVDSYIIARKISIFLLLAGLGISLVALCCGIIRAVRSSLVKRMIAVQFILEVDYDLSTDYSWNVNYYAVVKMALRDFLVTKEDDRDRAADRFHNKNETEDKDEGEDDDDDEIMRLGESLESFSETDADKKENAS